MSGSIPSQAQTVATKETGNRGTPDGTPFQENIEPAPRACLADTSSVETGASVCGLFDGPIVFEEDLDPTPTASDTMYGCGICFTLAGYSIKSFQQHQREHHAVVHNCKICNKTYQTWRGYENHMMSHIRYPCLHCPAEFQNFKETEEHQKKHFSKKLLRCDECGEEFYLLSFLNQHRSPSSAGTKCAEAHQNVDNPSSSGSVNRGKVSDELLIRKTADHAQNHPLSSVSVKSEKKVRQRKHLCEECGAEFFSSFSMSAHKLEHQND